MIITGPRSPRGRPVPVHPLRSSHSQLHGIHQAVQVSRKRCRQTTHPHYPMIISWIRCSNILYSHNNQHLLLLVTRSSQASTKECLLLKCNNCGGIQRLSVIWTGMLPRCIYRSSSSSCNNRCSSKCINRCNRTIPWSWNMKEAISHSCLVSSWAN